MFAEIVGISHLANQVCGSYQTRYIICGRVGTVLGHGKTSAFNVACNHIGIKLGMAGDHLLHDVFAPVNMIGGQSGIGRAFRQGDVSLIETRD